MEKTICDKVQALGPDLIQSVIAMVNIPSVKSQPVPGAPFGIETKKALEKALDISQALGFDTQIIENAVGYAAWGAGEDYIGVLGHVDVVPEGKGWQDPPFSGAIREEKIFGRGVLDNKGPIMAALYGLYALKSLGIPLKRPVRILFGTDEESGFADIPLYLKHEKPPLAGFTPDCKYPVVYSERGRAQVSVSQAHGAENYVEATQVFFDYLNQYLLVNPTSGSQLGIDYSHPDYGITEMRNFKLQSDPDQWHYRWSISYPPGITIDQIGHQIEETLPPGMTYHCHANYPPVYFDKESQMVKSMQKAYEYITGKDGSPVTTTGGTYAKVMPNIVPFGPSFPGQKGISHLPNEYMDIEDLINNAKIYALAIYYLANDSLSD